VSPLEKIQGARFLAVFGVDHTLITAPGVLTNPRPGWTRAGSVSSVKEAARQFPNGGLLIVPGDVPHSLIAQRFPGIPHLVKPVKGDDLRRAIADVCS
jgi:hypothetical protein